MFIAAHQRSTRTAPHQADTGPEVGRHFQFPCAPSATFDQPRLAGLAHRLIRRHLQLRSFDGLFGDLFQQPFDVRPGFIVAGRGEHVHAQAKAQSAPAGSGAFAHVQDAFSDHRRGLAPHQVGLRMGRADLFGGLRSATKIDGGRRCLGRDGGAACAAVIAPVIGLVATAPHGLEHF